MSGQTDSVAVLYDLLFGYAKSEVLNAGVELGVFETLAAGSATCEEIAKKCEVPELHLEKLLNSLCMLRLLNKTAGEKDVYENSPTANQYLVSSSPDAQTDTIIFYNMIKSLTSKVTEAVRKGGQVITKKDSITCMEKTKFQAGMAAIAKTSQPLVKAFDLGEFQTHVDVGGGTGTFARQVAAEYPDLDVTVCDLDRVIDTARSLPVNKDTRVNFKKGDFFKGDLPKADLYSMCHVLHDWSDAECDVIMKNVYDSVNPGGAVLILDSVYNDDKLGPLRINLTEMLQIATHDGKHRTKAEFETMLTKNGFKDVQLVRYDGFSFYEAILARKA